MLHVCGVGFADCISLSWTATIVWICKPKIYHSVNSCYISSSTLPARKLYKQCVLQFYSSINYPSVVKLAPCFFEDGFHCRTTIELEQNAYLGFIPGISVPSHFHKHVHTKPLAL